MLALCLSLLACLIAMCWKRKPKESVPAYGSVNWHEEPQGLEIHTA